MNPGIGISTALGGIGLSLVLLLAGPASVHAQAVEQATRQLDITVDRYANQRDIDVGQVREAIRNSRAALLRLLDADEQSPTGRAAQAAFLLHIAAAYEAIEDIGRWRGVAADAIATYRALIAEDEGNREFQRGLAIGMLSIGETDRRRGDLEVAQVAFEAAASVFEEIAVVAPGDLENLHDLSLARIRIGKILFAGGELDAALASFNAALEITERLVAANPGDPEILHELFACYANIGQLRWALGDPSAALGAIDRAIEIGRSLVETGDSNGVWRHELRLSRNLATRMRRAVQREQE